MTIDGLNTLTILRNTNTGHQSGWPIEQSAHLLFWEIGESEDCGFGSGAHGFKSWSIQTEDFKSDTCPFLARRSALLG